MHASTQSETETETDYNTKADIDARKHTVRDRDRN